MSEWWGGFLLVIPDDGPEGPALAELVCDHCNEVGPRVDDGTTLEQLVDEANRHWHECPAIHPRLAL